MIFETKRLILRQLTSGDFDNLCDILQDKEVMYAYEHAFSDDEVHAWLNKQLENYKNHGFGLWAVILKENHKFIGQTGLTYQKAEDENLLEIGYLFNKKYWHKGYATEAAAACKQYAFRTLGQDKVCSIIRDNNITSQNVARRIKMHPIKTIVKYYHGIHMPHIVFCAENDVN